MWSSIFAVLLFAALGDESCSTLHPLSVRMAMMEKLKRQTPEQDECVEAKLNETLPGSECVASVKGVEIALESSVEEIAANKDVLNVAFQELCKPECGKAFLQAIQECGSFESQSGVREFFIGICGNNRGTPCYQYFDGTTNITLNTYFCYSAYQETQTCQCEEVLKSAVESQGCCLTVYQNFARASAASEGSNYNPNKVYGYCNTRNPGDCNNSPLSASAGVVCSISAVVAAVLLAISAN